MSADAIGRYRTMCFSVRPLCNPTLMINGMTVLVSNESAHTTDGEQRRLSSRSGRCRMNNLSEHGFTSHSPPPPITLHQPIRELQYGETQILTLSHPAFTQPIMVLGNPLVLRVAESSWDRVMRLEPSATAFSAALFALRVRSTEILERWKDLIRGRTARSTTYQEKY
jgi:hypothetical protein